MAPGQGTIGDRSRGAGPDRRCTPRRRWSIGGFVDDGRVARILTDELCRTDRDVRARSMIRTIAGPDVQEIPIAVDGHEGFEVLVATRTVSWLDEGRSRSMKWAAEDDRPDRLGRYRMVTELHVRGDAIPSDAHFFRIEGWSIALIVSQVREAAARWLTAAPGGRKRYLVSRRLDFSPVASRRGARDGPVLGQSAVLSLASEHAILLPNQDAAVSEAARSSVAHLGWPSAWSRT